MPNGYGRLQSPKKEAKAPPYPILVFILMTRCLWGEETHYRFLKLGFLFSRKAVTPSLKSSVL